MADDPNMVKHGPVEEAQFSLAHALLAPLDAIFMAQLHAARSFLNMLLQLGYPHVPLDDSGNPKTEGIAQKDLLPYALKFLRKVETETGPRYERVAIPQLALVPVAPLGVENAEFHFEMEVKKVEENLIMQEAEEEKLKQEERWDKGKKRPWFLVRDPIRLDGTIAPRSGESASSRALIDVRVKVNRLPTPAGLEKLLSAMTEADIELLPEPSAPEGTPAPGQPTD